MTIQAVKSPFLNPTPFPGVLQFVNAASTATKNTPKVDVGTPFQDLVRDIPKALDNLEASGAEFGVKVADGNVVISIDIDSSEASKRVAQGQLGIEDPQESIDGISKAARELGAKVEPKYDKDNNGVTITFRFEDARQLLQHPLVDGLAKAGDGFAGIYAQFISSLATGLEGAADAAPDFVDFRVPGDPHNAVERLQRAVDDLTATTGLAAETLLFAQQRGQLTQAVDQSLAQRTVYSIAEVAIAQGINGSDGDRTTIAGLVGSQVFGGADTIAKLAEDLTGYNPPGAPSQDEQKQPIDVVVDHVIEKVKELSASAD